MNKFNIIITILAFVSINLDSKEFTIKNITNHYQNHFGWSISGDNDYVAISDPRDSINYYANGSVYIYKKFGYQWEYLQTINNPEIKSYDYFGHRVCMTGNFLAVTSLGDSKMGFMSGAVHIFKLENGNWVFKQTIRQSVTEAKSFFGEALYMNGQNLIIGAPGSEEKGAVYVYSVAEESFALLQRISNPDSFSSQFGKSLALSNDMIFVGAPSPNKIAQKGSVYLFSRNGSTWEVNKTQPVIEPEDINDGSMFGASISVEGNKLLIGAPHSDVTGQDAENYYYAGKAHFYSLSNSSGKFDKTAEFTNPKLDSHDIFGSQVIISDSLLYMSAPKDDISEADNGNVYIFKTENGEWTSSSLNDKESESNQYFGHNFYVDGYNIFVAPAGIKDEKDKGVLYTYDVRDVIETDKEKEKENSQAIEIFPNPADNKIRIVISENTDYKLRICSNEGKVIFSKDLKGNKEIDLSTLANGYYLVSIKTKQQSFLEKLVIRHIK